MTLARSTLQTSKTLDVSTFRSVEFGSLIERIKRTGTVTTTPTGEIISLAEDGRIIYGLLRLSRKSKDSLTHTLPQLNGLLLQSAQTRGRPLNPVEIQRAIANLNKRMADSGQKQSLPLDQIALIESPSDNPNTPYYIVGRKILSETGEECVALPPLETRQQYSFEVVTVQPIPTQDERLQLSVYTLAEPSR
ncbi:MAG: hypothetical protein WCP97_07270 [bacterium]